jgi:putative PEP-CTERM system TPR-repeat lipoprotein
MNQHRPATSRFRHLLAASSLIALATCFTAFTPANADTQQSQRFYNEGVQQLQSGNASAAVIQLRNAIQQDPANLKARQLLGQLYLRTGDAVSAEKELRRVFEAQRGDEVELHLAQALMMQRRYGDVFSVLSPQGATPELTQAKLVMSGQAYMGTGQIDDAENQFRAALETAPNLAEAKLGLARIDALRNRTDEARRSVDEVLATSPDNLEALLLSADIAFAGQRADDALASLNRAAALSPDNPRVLLPRARVRLQTGSINEAEKDVSRVLERAPRDVMARYMKASIQLIRGDANAARTTFQPIEGALADYPPALLLSSLIKFNTGQYAQAEASINRFLAVAPGHVPARRTLAAIQLRSNNTLSAIEALKPLVADHLDDLIARQMLAGAYLRQGDMGNATAMFEELAKSPNRAMAARARSTLSLLQAADAGSRDMPPETRRSVALVLDYIRNGEFAKAHETVDSLKQADADNPQLISLEAAIFAAEGDMGTAKSRLQAASALDPSMSEIANNLNLVDARMGNLDAVEKRLRDAVSASPGDEQAVLRLGQFLAQNQRLNEAEDTLESAASRYPNSITIRRILGELYERRDDKPKLLETAGQLRQIGNAQPEALKFAAATYRAGGDPARAADTLRIYVKAKPDDAEAQIALAQNLIAANRAEEARPVLETVKAKDPASAVATLGLVDLALARNDADGALKLADGLRQANPIAAAQLRSSILLRTNRVDEAIRAMEQALQATPDRQLALGLYGLRRDNGRMDQAVSGLEDWVKRNPGDVAARTVLADTYLTRQDLKQAEMHYDILVQARPGDPALLNNAAWIAHELGSPQALQYARRAHAAAPSAPEIADTLGWILVQSGETAEGVELLRSAAAGAPSNPDVQYHLAYALHATGAKDEAREILEKLAADGKPFQSREEAAKLLATIGK